MKTFEEEKEDMFNKFKELQKTGGKITLGDTMSSELKNQFYQINNNSKDGLEMQVSIFRSQLTKETPDTKYIKKDFDKFYKKMSKSPNITNLTRTNFSFGFNFNNEEYIIAYDFGSECYVLYSNFNDPKLIDATEIGYYELEERYF
jgi:hypothetical protein